MQPTIYTRFSLILAVISLSIGASAQNMSPVFEQQTLDDDVSIGYGLAIGDVDGDERPDILLADKKQFVWYRNPDWQRFVMVENLTEHDNVCLAARDVNEDGIVEVAVGAQWNPGETSNAAQSGSVHYLIRPDDPTERWEPIQLPHEPTIHRMQWVEAPGDTYQLVVLPLHGRGNKGGQGVGVKVIAYHFSDSPLDPWDTLTLDQSMHMTHNFDIEEGEDQSRLYIGGKEGVKVIEHNNGQWLTEEAELLAGVGTQEGVGEVRLGHLGEDQPFITAIEPMHGTTLAVYYPGTNRERQVLYSDFNQGHALATADLLGLELDQIVAGWRDPNSEGKVGIVLFIPADPEGSEWEKFVIDDNTMACEDLKVADLNADGKPDIIAAGRATNNLKIYWNKSSVQ